MAHQFLLAGASGEREHVKRTHNSPPLPSKRYACPSWPQTSNFPEWAETTFAENALAVAMAMQLHILNDAHLAGDNDPLFLIFDERLSPLDGNQYFRQTDQPADFESIFHVAVSLVVGLDVQDSSVLTHVLILMERARRRRPGVLTLYTLRPILVTAFIVCLKLNSDEEIDCLADGLQHVGFTSIDNKYIARLQYAFLSALNWKVSVDRMTYFWYTLELRNLIRTHMKTLVAAFPRMVKLVAQLDATREPNQHSTTIRACNLEVARSR
jgi:hypothetical protein